MELRAAPAGKERGNAFSHINSLLQNGSNYQAHLVCFWQALCQRSTNGSIMRNSTLVHTSIQAAQSREGSATDQ
jgi:hypothetical protein